MEAGGPRVEHDDHMMAGPGLFVAGYASGTTSLTQAMLEGRIAGIGAAEYAGRAGPEALRIREEYLGQLRALRESAYAWTSRRRISPRPSGRATTTWSSSRGTRAASWAPARGSSVCGTSWSCSADTRVGV